jgi:hypothetical protein
LYLQSGSAEHQCGQGVGQLKHKESDVSSNRKICLAEIILSAPSYSYGLYQLTWPVGALGGLC